MKDIDFDELDRAVSSLMSSVPKNKPVKVSDEDITLVIPGSTADVPAEEPKEDISPTSDVADTESEEVEPVLSPSREPEQPPEHVDEPEQEKTLPPAASIQPAPNRGRFMDMVRPTRDSRKISSLMTRPGVTLQPSSSMRFRGSAASQEVSAQQSSDTGVDLAAQTTVMQEREDTTSVAAASSEAALSMPAGVAQGNPYREAEDTTPLSSPFLSNAKVEKRPLGRPAEATPLDSSDTGELTEETYKSPIASSIPMEEPGVSPDIDAQRPEEPLPAELDSKLLSIETGEDAPHQEPAFLQSQTPEAVTPPASSSTEGIPPSIDAPRTMAAASIQQQYKLETGSKEEVPAGGIYDTQPLAHPAKSKPGWLWILAIIGILVLGALGGAAVYYLGLI